MRVFTNHDATVIVKDGKVPRSLDVVAMDTGDPPTGTLADSEEVVELRDALNEWLKAIGKE